MKLIDTLIGHLKGDRGEGAMATVAGSVLFIFASASIAGFFGLSLGATALAQSNQQLTVALEADVQAWEQTAWSELAAQAGTRTDVVVSAGREYNVTRVVEFKAEITAYTMTVSAPRAVVPGAEKSDCTEAAYSFIDGCTALSGSITATPDDVQPQAPLGVTVTSEDVDGTGAATNLIADPGFESGAFGAWTGEGNAAIIVTDNPRSSGAHILSIGGADGQSGALSNRVNVTPGDQLQAQIWVQSSGSTGAVNVAATFWDGTTSSEVSVLLVQSSDARDAWSSVTGTINVPPGAEYVSLTVRTAGGATTCDDSCNFIVDDASLSILRKNLAPNGGLENSAPLWPGGSIVAAANPTDSGVSVLEFAGASAQGESVSFDVYSGQYVAEVSLRNAGISGGTGTVSYSVTLPNDSEIPISVVPVSGIGGDWVRLNGTIDIPSGVSTAKLNVLIGGAEPESKLHFDNFTIGRVAAAADDPSINGYVRLATLDLAILKSADLRLSFEYLGDGAQPTDLKLAVFCATTSSASSVAESVVARAGNAGGETWYWARVQIAAFDRLADCDNPDIRIYASGGETPEASEIGSVSVLAVLPTQPTNSEDGQ
jgi:hypothetical protein